MARPRSFNGMTIAEIERMLETRKRAAAKLKRQRVKLEHKLANLDRQIMALDGTRLRGGAGFGAGGRPRNERSLVGTLEFVLGKSSKPMRVGDLVDAVLRTGYRTTSDNFRGIVNQTLIKEKQFGSAGRGLYQLKK